MVGTTTTDPSAKKNADGDEEPKKPKFNAVASSEKLLDSILKTRIQRKAKIIVRSGVHFLIACIVILQTAAGHAGNGEEASGAAVQEGGGQPLAAEGEEEVKMEVDFSAMLGILFESALGNMVGFFALFVITLMVFLLHHAAHLRPASKTNTKKEVEDAYKETNKYAPFDGILELAFPYKFKGRAWALPYFVMGTALFLVLSGLLIYIEIHENVSGATKAAIVAALLLLYQICSDFAEYWVHTRNQVSDKNKATFVRNNPSSKMV